MQAQADAQPAVVEDDSGDELVTAAASARAGRRQRRADFSWSGLADDGDDRAASNRAGQSWSFRDAIARIDAEAYRGNRKQSRLSDTVNAVVKAGATTAESERAAASSTAAAKSSSDRSLRRQQDGDDDEDEDDDADEAEDHDDDDDDDDDDGEDDSEDDKVMDDDDDDDDDDDEQDDGEDAEDAEEEDGNIHADDDADDDEVAVETDTADAVDTGAAMSATSLVSGSRRDEAEEILARAKPNPFKQRAAAAVDADPEEYRGFFAPDPFSEAAKDVVKAKATASGKRRREDTESDSTAAADLGHVVATTASGAVVTSKEPTSFNEMNLSRPLLRAVTALGFTNPTPIQRRCVPLCMAGHDVCGSAVTGSGKTAAYLLPILERLQYKPARIAATRVVILTPTRELATQVHSMATALSQFCKGITIALVVGGVALKPQEAELRARPDIVVATPGRLLDHLRNTLSVNCDDVDVLVLDEADRLLEMGFEDELHEIVKMCPVGRQTLLFSATMTARVDALAKLSLRNPIRIVADALGDMAARLSQEFVRVRAGHEADREPMLMALLTRSFTGGGVLVFALQKVTAHRVAVLCNLAGLRAAELHGNLTQRQRLEALEDFREGRVDYLIATDLAGRGLDIAGVRVVVNLEMPLQLNAYIHRVGRTARAGRAGVAVTLVSEDQRSMMKDIVKRAALNVRSRTIPGEVVAAWRAKIEGWHTTIERVQQAEREERALRIAEREADRAQNLITHAEEIHARPPRTWFKTEREKQETRAKSAAAAQGAPEPEESAARQPAADDGPAARKSSKPHRLTRKKRRRMEELARVDKEERRVARAERMASQSPGGVADPKVVQARRELEKDATAMKTQRSHAKSAKNSARSAAARLGIPMSRVERKLKQDAGGARKKPRSAAATGAPSAFESDASSASRAGKSAHTMPTHKPGRKSFKSSARFKRR